MAEDTPGRPENGKKQEGNGNGKKQQPQQEGAAGEDYKDRYLRLLAEFDNYKKRTAADQQNSKGVGKAELAKKMLPALDEFELAMLAVGGFKDNAAVVKGFEMVYSNLKGALEREGLRELDAKGKFDPYKHEIVTMREDAKRPPGTILEVVKKGYTFDDILIRPAAVIVAKEVDEGEKKAEKKQ